MHVPELPSGGQLSIHGNVVNVPADVNSTVSVLPRPINESQTTPIKLKQCLCYRHHYQFQNIRATKVLEAAQYLFRNSEIFKNKGIQVMNNYTSNTDDNEDEWSEFISEEVVVLLYYLCIGIYFFTYSTKILLGAQAHFILFFYINKLLYLTRGHSYQKVNLYNPAYLVSITTQHGVRCVDKLSMFHQGNSEWQKVQIYCQSCNMFRSL